MDDAQIIDEISTGGINTMTKKEIDKLEEEKVRQYVEEMRKQGLKALSLSDAKVKDEGFSAFEEF